MECILVAQFQFGLPRSFDHVKSQILVRKDFPSLSDVFNHLCQALLSYSSSDFITYSSDRSALVYTVGGRGNKGRGNRGRGDRDQRGGRGRGRGPPRKCTP